MKYLTTNEFVPNLKGFAASVEINYLNSYAIKILLKHLQLTIAVCLTEGIFPDY